MGDDLTLRPTTVDDLPAFFRFQRDPGARRMAAFMPREAENSEAFMERWDGILANPAATNQTIMLGDRTVGMIACFERAGDWEVTYWIGREYWGRGFATQALGRLLELVDQRPLYGRAAGDNIGSIRVLEKNGFVKTHEERAFAPARGEEIDEVVLRLS